MKELGKHFSILEQKLKKNKADRIENRILTCFCPNALEPYILYIKSLKYYSHIPSDTSIFILQGENDTQTPVQQAFLLQQRLTELNHPNHMLKTYQASDMYFIHLPNG